jgi:hypothetical protein
MNTHWIDYTPGTVARVTNKEPVDKRLKQTISSDVNKLSRIVVKFNDWLVYGKKHRLPFGEKLTHLSFLFHTL